MPAGQQIVLFLHEVEESVAHVANKIIASRFPDVQCLVFDAALR